MTIPLQFASLYDLRVVQLPAGSWHELPQWKHGLCMRCVVSCSSTSFPKLVFFSGVRQIPEDSGEQGMEETGCEIIYGAPTTLAVKG